LVGYAEIVWLPSLLVTMANHKSSALPHAGVLAAGFGFAVAT
jgi:hypothetical protein